MAVELVLMVPVLMAFALLVVAMGRYVAVRGEVEGLSRDAVRAASLERDVDSAQAAANSTMVATAPASLSCAPAVLDGAFEAGGIITVSVTCQVSWSGLGLIGLSGTRTITATSAAPLDTYRRAG